MTHGQSFRPGDLVDIGDVHYTAKVGYIGCSPRTGVKLQRGNVGCLHGAYIMAAYTYDKQGAGWRDDEIL